MDSSGTSEHEGHAAHRRTFLAYAAMVAVATALFLIVRWRGESLVAPNATVTTEPAAATHSTLFAHVLIALAAITLLARVVGGAFRRWLRQPPVMGEILAGIVLGPSVLGVVWPEACAFVLPASAAPYLSVIAKVGVVLFMFLVGLELDTRLLRGNTYATIAISHASIVVPFALGSMLALALYPLYGTGHVGFTVFALFFGVSLSVTAFPVLARILTDRRVQHTKLGATALACAAVGDVTAWTMLALVAGFASAEVSGIGWTIVWVVAYVAFAFLVGRPLLRRFAARQERCDSISHTALAVVFVTLLLSALVTEAIGIHALFGAFLVGAMLPHEGRLAHGLREKLHDVVVVLFLPVFFAFTGMRTQIGLLATGQDWLACGLIVLVATAGKFGGSYVAARWTGYAPRRAAALGVLMNTRGLMELIVLNLGLDLKVITPALFTMMIVMALVTTFSTTPVLDALLGARGFADAPQAESGASASRASSGEPRRA